jgi:hypothetical protein
MVVQIRLSSKFSSINGQEVFAGQDGKVDKNRRVRHKNVSAKIDAKLKHHFTIQFYMLCSEAKLIFSVSTPK